MPIRIDSKNITIKEIVDLLEYLQNLKLEYQIMIYSDDEYLDPKK